MSGETRFWIFVSFVLLACNVFFFSLVLYLGHESASDARSPQPCTSYFPTAPYMSPLTLDDYERTD